MLYKQYTPLSGEMMCFNPHKKMVSALKKSILTWVLQTYKTILMKKFTVSFFVSEFSDTSTTSRAGPSSCSCEVGSISLPLGLSVNLGTINLLISFFP